MPAIPIIGGDEVGRMACRRMLTCSRFVDFRSVAALKEDESVEASIGQADKTMYRAKQEGRNCAEAED